jgi:hypothetical protein
VANTPKPSPPPPPDPELEKTLEEVDDALAGMPQYLGRLRHAAQQTSKAVSRLTKTTRTVRSTSQQRIPAQPDPPPAENGRREHYLARNLSGALDLILSRCAEAGVDPSEQPRTWLATMREDLARIMGGAWADGAHYAVELEVEAVILREMRTRLEALLREHGIPVPTDPKPRPKD